MFSVMSMILDWSECMDPGSRLTAANGGHDKRELINFFSAVLGACPPKAR